MPEIVYEDNHLLIAVKAPNQLTQGDATGDDSLLDELKRYIKDKYQKPGEVYLGLVHRLDRPVGGLVAFARTSKAAARLSEQLRVHSMRREYLAVCENGASLQRNGTLRNYLAKDDVSGSVAAVPEGTPGAQEAVLHYEKLAERDSFALVRVSLETGRKHQIRVQMAAAGHPLRYDMRYGRGQAGQPVALWGALLRLTHPTLKTSLLFKSTPRGDAFAPFSDAVTAFLASATEENNL